MKMFFINKKLWTIVHSPPVDMQPDNEQNQEALSYIGLYVKPHHYPTINSCLTANQAWLALESAYKGRNEARVQQLRQELSTLKKAASEPLAVYVSRARQLADDLASAGLPVNMAEVAYLILQGLPPEYDMARTALQVTGQALSVESLLPKLQPIEEKLKKTNADNAAYAVQQHNRSRNYRNNGQLSSNRGPAKCFKCLKPGHRAADCKSNPSPHAKKCDKCGMWGHTTGACRSNNRRESNSHVAFAFCSTDSEHSWILDSGCTNHITPDKNKFETYEELHEPVYFSFANGQQGRAVGRGDIKLTVNNLRVTLQRVLHVPQAAMNLISVKRIMESGAKVEYDKGTCTISKEHKVLFEVKCHNGLFSIYDNSHVPEQQALASVKTTETAQLWHQRFGHLSYSSLSKLVKGQMVDGISIKPEEFETAGKTVCGSCIQAKQPRQPFQTSSTVTTKPLELVHMDVCGPMPTTSIGGSRYFATFLDDYSKLSIVIPISSKADVPDQVKRTIKMLETQTGHNLLAVRTDRGTEYMNHDLRNYFDSKGVIHQTSVPYTPQQNGAAERLNRTLLDRVRAMLLNAGVEEKLWAEAVVTANYIRNRSPSKQGAKTPWELCFGKKPDVSNMRVFGSRAYVLTPKQQHNKLEPVSEPGVFVGYAANSKAYRVLLDNKEKVVEARDVVIDETAHVKNNSSSNNINSDNVKQLKTLSLDDDKHTAPNAQPTGQPQPETMATEAPDVTIERTVSEEGELRGQPRIRTRVNESVPQSRYPSRPRRQPDRYVAGLVKEVDEPDTVEQALSGPDAELWKRAMDEEINSHMENQTW